MQIIEASNLNEIAKMIEKRIPFIINSAQVNPIAVENIPKNAILSVESKWKNQFGAGIKTKITFGEFMENIKSDKFYLSTQYENESDEIDPILMPPLNEIRNDLTVNPKFSFNLILQQMNVWIGSGLDNSSGLHHDFHDNFYFLQKGVKKFRLYSPEQYKLMYLYGKVTRLHENGLIVYNNESIREDGAYLQDVIDWKISKAEKALENATTEGEMEKAEAEMDNALEESLKFQSLDEIDDENLNDTIDASPATKKLKVDEEKPHFPPSFSKIPAYALEDPEILSKQFPEFLKAKVLEVTLNPGQVLFIPTGWFHEVKSSATNDDYHLALNYWYAPLASGESVFCPYVDDYWKELKL